MKWRDVVEEYQDYAWGLMRIPSMYALEVFIGDIELTNEVLQWIPDPEGRIRVRVKFHDLPCVELKGTYQENPEANNKESKVNIQRKRFTFTSEMSTRGDRETLSKGFDPTKCLVKEKLEPPAPKVHKLPGEEESDTESRRGSKSSEKSPESYNSEQSIEESEAGATVKALHSESPIKSIAFNDGRTVVFTSTPSELIYSLLTVPLAVNFFIGGPRVIGHTIVGLQQLSEIISISIDSQKNIPCSAILDGKFNIQQQGRIIGSVEFDLRLTCLGSKMAHVVTERDNPNVKKEMQAESSNSQSLRVLRINQESKPSQRIEKLLEADGVSEVLFPPAYKNASTAAPILMISILQRQEDEELESKSKAELEKQEDKPRTQKEWFRYRCTDFETIIQRRVLEDLIRNEKPPFNKGSPFRKLVCPDYLKKMNIDWKKDSHGEKIHKHYVPCPANQKETKEQKRPNYCACSSAKANHDNKGNGTRCHMKKEALDPEDALQQLAGIDRKVKHYKNLLNNIVLDSDVNVQKLETPIEDYETSKDPYKNIARNLIPQVVQNLPEMLANARTQRIEQPREHHETGTQRFSKGWKCLEEFCRCKVHK